MLPACCHSCHSYVIKHTSFEYGSFDPIRFLLDMTLYFVAVFVLCIKARSSELISFLEMLGGCNDLQLRNISRNSIVDLHCLFAGLL
jgi:hypothetical protein